MQDSIEDYVKISSNTQESKINEERRKEMILTGQRQRACEAHSMRIVELLIEDQIKPEALLIYLRHINQELYQDVVEERALSKLCGYALCGKKLPEMPKKQFFISTKANKIYDISDRKNYCSNYCYKASVHLKQQVETSPLWVRKQEDNLKFNFLPNTEIGIPGELIDQGIVKSDLEPSFTSVTSFAELSLDEVDKIEIDSKRKQQKKKSERKKYDKESTMPTINEDEIEKNVHQPKIVDENAKDLVLEIKKPVESDSSKVKPVRDINSDILKYKETMLEIPKDCDKTSRDYTDDKLRGIIERSKSENIKIAEITHLYPAIQVKKIATELPECLEESGVDSSNIAFLNRRNSKPSVTHADDKFKAILQKCKAKSKKQRNIQFTEILPVNPDTLHHKMVFSTDNTQCSVPREDDETNTMRDKLERVRTSMKEWFTLDTCIFLHGFDNIKRILNDNKIEEYFDSLRIRELKVQQQMKYMDICKRLQLREMAQEKFDKAVVSQTLMPLPDYQKLKEAGKDMDLKVRSFFEGSLYAKDDTNFPTLLNKEEQTEASLVLPLIDSTSQNMLRRKVLMSSVNKTLNMHMQELELDAERILLDVQSLVKTFNLQAHNTVFKAGLWDVISMVLIELLCVRDEKLQAHLQQQRQEKYINLILNKHPGSKDCIREILNFMNVETFVESYVSNDSI